MPFHFIACITVPDTYWRLACVGARKVLACMEHVEMPWYELAWFNIKFIWDQFLESRREVTKEDLGTWNALRLWTWHLLVPSVGVPSTPLLEKLNWWLINPLMCSFPCSLTCFSLLFPWHSLAHINTPLNILACLITGHLIMFDMPSHYLAHLRIP